MNWGETFFDHIMTMRIGNSRMQSIVPDCGLRYSTLWEELLSSGMGTVPSFSMGMMTESTASPLGARWSRRSTPLRERIEYGDGGSSTQPEEERANRAVILTKSSATFRRSRPGGV